MFACQSAVHRRPDAGVGKVSAPESAPAAKRLRMRDNSEEQNVARLALDDHLYPDLVNLVVDHLADEPSPLEVMVRRQRVEKPEPARVLLEQIALSKSRCSPVDAVEMLRLAKALNQATARAVRTALMENWRSDSLPAFGDDWYG